MNAVLGLADVDGVLCVTSEDSNFQKPELFTLHWPTIARTYDVLQYFQVDSLDKLKVEESIPGEYSISELGRSWYRTRLALRDGSRTKSIKITTRPYPRPKRAREAEYRDGRWHKVLGGRWVAC